MQYPNGVPADEITSALWVKSTRSNATGGNCVEVTALPGGEVAVRNSRDPHGPALVYSRAEMAAFVSGARDGEFDHLIG
ncbi:MULTISPECIES: DUF397 domain-containing protein [Streptomyces]|uniref:DUF397 domain-containing protein n=1 Tax=Streptomyces nodosus TaxID=40318 RepID=A0A0B5DE09_9ACTN|nr:MULTISPECIES: DUF397 domain-containing protein [Streptomyces]AJE38686.1 hypothetical protein SNOD_00085 [Streptomyces nodosus]MBB4796177.1 hypothetical protein [Streptomyces nodosus]MYV46713.1 DUF397 domain-containing protein [Streptomyces sp. SID2888]QEV37261.1 DUF397 domain-containing protein [Streptomyces nodosus]